MYNSDASAIRVQHTNRKLEFVLINVNGKAKVYFQEDKIFGGNET